VLTPLNVRSHVQQAAGLDDVHRAREAAVLQDVLRQAVRAEGRRVRTGGHFGRFGQGVQIGQCYDFFNIFAEKFSEKIGIFDSKQS
jgi:hypothetical protein